MKVLPATPAGIAMAASEVLSPSAVRAFAANRCATRAAAARISATVFPRALIAATALEMIGEPPRAGSNIQLKVEKLLKVGEAKVEFIASMSAEVPPGLNGTSDTGSPEQPVRAIDTSVTVTTDRFANCSTRMNSASVLGSS